MTKYWFHKYIAYTCKSLRNLQKINIPSRFFMMGLRKIEGEKLFNITTYHLFPWPYKSLPF